MIRLPMVRTAAAALTFTLTATALTFTATTGVADAEPSPPPCAYTLSPPHVVTVSGTQMVTATLAPAACDRSMAYLSVACVQMQGSDGPGQCAQGQGILTAQVYFTYRPGATYIATGRGCASTGNPPRPVCQSNGPITATL